MLETDYNGGGDIRADLGELRKRSPFHTIGLWLTADLIGQKWYGAARLLRDQANRCWLTDALDHSLRAPEHRPTAVTPIIRNAFAFAFHIAGMHREAREQLGLLDGQVTEWPWGYLDSPTRAFVRVRLGVGI